MTPCGAGRWSAPKRRATRGCGKPSLQQANGPTSGRRLAPVRPHHPAGDCSPHQPRSRHDDPCTPRRRADRKADGQPTGVHGDGHLAVAPVTPGQRGGHGAWPVPQVPWRATVHAHAAVARWHALVFKNRWRGIPKTAVAVSRLRTIGGFGHGPSPPHPARR